jgi:hypothetical protein
MAVIAKGHAALARSFIVPQKPQFSFWVAGIWFVVFIVGSLGLIVSTPVVTRCSIEKPSVLGFNFNLSGSPDPVHALAAVGLVREDGES